MKVRVIKLSSIVYMLVFLSACTQVKPWERGDLALSQMALEGDAQEAGVRHHTFASKESATGGYGGAGGGCGCN
ncbi:DUF4266 domain-containing protein [methanotrophic endosymbiont of Bathymodiolus puteoserpentis (Logatchev)]|jgi:hypothetical protein|uniref:DUF4266 domain-containing protein n=1 Tax=methanotrophic endosymbiont of Bathymodiolus puteoserpentis (Logatchev) TaxID=343235 RepID=UPI00157AA386|nr:DUF4266 domain-containing protein [methanotrophic endosymbiont of Bathymodiolus puteoserpentis (Logatchev)]